MTNTQRKKDDPKKPKAKDSDVKESKPKDKEPVKRRSRPDHDDDDDSSVDSKGNIRGLFDYEEDETASPECSWRASSSSDEKSKKKKKATSPAKKVDAKKSVGKKITPSPTVEKSKRASAIKAQADIKATLEKEEEKKKKRKQEFERLLAEAEAAEEEEDEEEEEEEDEEDEDDEDEEDEDEEDEDEEEEEEETAKPRLGGIELLISDFSESYPQKPKKYKLKTEPENVRRFVKLAQADIDPNEEDIDRDIGYFKALTPGAQDRLLKKLQSKVEPTVATVPLRFQILAKEVAPEVERVALSKYTALQNIDPSSTEYYKAGQWIHGYTQLPLNVFKDLPVKLEDGAETCQNFVTNVRKCMDDAIYGHEDAKLQILQFVSSWISNPTGSGNVLSIHGPPGVGKTTLIKDGVAKALGRPFHFITLGGATDASFLDGHSYTYEGSTWGRIVDVLIKSKCMNPIIYFDELDKVSETPKGEEINNLLIHLTDGSQNDRFQDKYFTGIDLNLSRCLFIFSHNNHERVNPILRDRMYNIQVGGFNLKEKLVIAEQYLVNSALREVNLFEKIGISKEIITNIIENHTGEEKGVRELKRCIQTIVSKMNMLRFYNDPTKVPFAISGFSLPFTMKKDHVELFLKKKAVKDESFTHMYT